jgi:hypothetical protein
MGTIQLREQGQEGNNNQSKNAAHDVLPLWDPLPRQRLFIVAPYSWN